jgi:Fe-S oxidoreductase
MNAHEIGELESLCIQEEAAYCSAACPVHVDIRTLTKEIKKGNFDKALKLYKKQVLFPGIISRICDEPCREVCIRKELDEAVAVRMLEKSCVDYANLTEDDSFAVSRKSKRIAVIGGGLSGLSCTLELLNKGYQVTVLEQNERLGGRLWDFNPSVLPPRVITEELEKVEEAGAEICLNKPVGDIFCLEYDAVYIATGLKGNTFGLLLNADGKIQVDAISLAASKDKIFAGGSILEQNGHYSPIACVSYGVRAARSIDRYFKKASLTSGREHEGSYATRLYTDIKEEESKPMFPRADYLKGFSREEAGKEALRCIQCECMACVKACNFLRFYNEYPKRYVKHISKSLNVVPTLGTRFASRMINSCSLCGLCKEKCPTDFDMGLACREARERMVEAEDMPPAFHDFFLRDMSFSNNWEAFLVRKQPGTQSNAFLFFPGCQLGASSPEYVEKAYRYLMERLTGGVGLILGCCGAPAEWAGRQDLQREQLEKFEDGWRELGKPEVIAACPSCLKIFREYLPEVRTTSIWTLMVEKGLSLEGKRGNGRTVAVYDPCSSRYDPQTQESVRNLLTSAGYVVKELQLHGKYAQCCSYGGLILATNPELAAQISHERIHASPHPYVTYCINCRDDFAGKGKPVSHVLDLLLPEDIEEKALRKPPGYSLRRENRLRLKELLLKNLWGETMETKAKSYEEIKLIVPPEILEKIERELILLEEIQQVIYYAENTGNKILQSENNRFIAHLQLGIITYWVEFLPHNGAYKVFNVYSHRMHIIEKKGK